MDAPTDLGRIFSPCHCIDILLYISEHPGCMKTDLYRNVSRNTSTPSRIETMEAAGLLIIEDRGRAVLLTLTENGYAVAKLFREAEDILSSSQNGC